MLQPRLKTAVILWPSDIIFGMSTCLPGRENPSQPVKHSAHKEAGAKQEMMMDVQV